MKLIFNNNYSRHKEQYLKDTHGKQSFYSDGRSFNNGNNSNKNSNNNISFTSLDASGFQKIISKTNKKITTYTNMSSVSESINKILGNDFFESVLDKTKLFINKENDQLQIINSNIGIELLKVLKYPIVDLPRDLINSFFRFLSKAKPFKGFANSVLKLSPLKNRADFVFQEKNKNLLLNVLETFANKDLGLKIGEETNFNLEKCANYFKEKAANQMTKTVPNYYVKDERALNRLATGLVSSLFGAWDFHNISMLQKDDKNEAKEAGKSRFKQEMSRMCANAGITYLTLGVLNKYIKNSLALNVAAIGIGALIAEVGSRIINKTPLLPLTPAQAAKLAEQKKSDKNKSDNKEVKGEEQQSENTVKQMPMKGSTKEEQVFGKFLSDKGAITPLEMLQSNTKALKDEQPKTKKKMSLKKALLYAFGITSAVYLLSAIIKGEFKFNKEIKKIYNGNTDKINDYINNEVSNLDKGVSDKIEAAKTSFKNRSDKFDIFGKLKDRITKYTKEINLTELSKRLEAINKETESKEISEILDKYVSVIDRNKAEILKNQAGKIDEDKAKDIIFKAKDNIPGITGIYEGVAKIFRTAYQVFSLPGLAIKSLINRVLYKNSNAAYQKIKTATFKGKDKDLILELDKIVKKCMSNPEDKEGAKKAIEMIKKNVRNVSDSPEIGELANYARTCVTVISSFFFINDYRNRVLIESGGKDVKKAEEEKNQRIAQKLANFVVNGTLMNLFNSTFKTQINSGLVPAAINAVATETTNEFMVRKLINSPILPKDSKQEIVDFEEKQSNKKGIAGWWSKTYRKLTGKKSLSEKAGVTTDKK